MGSKAVVLAVMSMTFATAYGYVASTTPFSLNPTSFASKSNFKACVTKDGLEGLCVHETYCNDEHQIERFGNIDDSELRSFECYKEVEWCCYEKNVTKVKPPATLTLEERCIVTERPDCPWCVKLYRDGNDHRKLDSGFFCMGTMIASTVILTTGTCMIQAQNQAMWARIPSSANPDTNYTVKYRAVHPKYNSGTRAYDMALLAIENEVQWGPTGSKGACIGLNEALEGDCLGAGVDDDENIDMTPLYVSKGTCGSGDSVDASCGLLFGDDCSVVPGSPIMCRAKGGPFIMVGQAKLPCLYEPPKSLLGNLNVASKWLEDHLKGTMALSEKNFIHSFVPKETPKNSLLILFLIVDTFSHALIHLYIMIELSKTGILDASSIFSMIAEAFVFGWTVKNLILFSFFVISCEEIYIMMPEVERAVCMIAASKDIGESQLALIKNVVRVNRVCGSKLSACGLLSVDATLPLRLFNQIAAYALVMLQFAVQ